MTGIESLGPLLPWAGRRHSHLRTFSTLSLFWLAASVILLTQAKDDRVIYLGVALGCGAAVLPLMCYLVLRWTDPESLKTEEHREIMERYKNVGTQRPEDPSEDVSPNLSGGAQPDMTLSYGKDDAS